MYSTVQFVQKGDERCERWTMLDFANYRLTKGNPNPLNNILA